MDQFSKLGPVQAFSKFWGTLSNTQRFVTAVFLSTSIALLLVVSVVATRPKMTVLFSGLQPEDSGTIIAKLQETKIPYEVDGSAIKVPAKDVYETRMQLASQGLPEGGTIGFEIFDKTNLGMTEFTQKLNYQRALQGELSRTIDQIDSVSQSRVHIAIPEESVFVDNEKAPTASVILKLRSGNRMSSDQVGGIVRLVSAAVEGLTPNHVTVVDTDGNMLSEPTDDVTGMDPRMSSSQLRLKTQYEQQVQQDIQSMLERVLGANKAVVRVNAKINFDRKERNSETYEPAATNDPAGANKGVLISEERLEETYNGSGGRPPASVAGREGGYERIENNAKYDVSKTTEHVMTAPGQVEKMSVAVMVDGKVDSSKITSIENVVSTAAGIDPERGDKVTVESMAFDDSAIKKQAKEMEAVASKSTYLTLGKNVGGVLLLFGFLFFLKGMLKQIKVQIPEPTTVEQLSAAPAGAVQGYDATPHAMNAASGAVSSSVGQAPPQEVAKALRTWIGEQ